MAKPDLNRSVRLDVRMRADERRVVERAARAARERPTAWARRVLITEAKRAEQVGEVPVGG
jgi:hypothetical protein